MASALPIDCSSGLRTFQNNYPVSSTHGTLLGERMSQSFLHWRLVGTYSTRNGGEVLQNPELAHEMEQFMKKAEFW